MAGAAELLALTIRRARVLPVGDGGVTLMKKLAFLAELAGLGCRVKNPDAYDDSLLAHHAEIVQTLQTLRGGHVPYVPLFASFPNSVPDQHDYFVDRVVGYLGNWLGTFDEGVVLDSGLRIPSWLFDLEQFGADPVTQFQDRGLFDAALVRQAGRTDESRTQWTELELVPAIAAEERIRRFLTSALYAGSSIKEALRPDIEVLLEHFGIDTIDVERVRFKETLTYLMRYRWRRGDAAGAVALAKTPTDLLRLFAALTDSDVSLGKPIRYPRLTRRERRLVLAKLEEAPELAGQLKRYRDLWKVIGRGLHPGEYAARHPKAAAAFQALRRDDVSTWDGAVEVAIRDRAIADAIRLLVERPGMFGRRVHHLASIAGPDRARVVEAFRETAPKMTIKHLLVLDTYLRSVDESPRRAVVNKRGTVRVIASRQHRLDGETRARLSSAVEEALELVIARDKSSWIGQKVWIDPVLRQIAVPLQQRKASDGVLTLGRGSKLPLTEGRVLRLFVWWKQAHRRTDLDLSVVAYDEAMRYVAHVSWTKLSDAAMRHSGDIQSAPLGAAEFLDIDIAEIMQKKPEARYLAPQIHRFCGDDFGAMTCFAGWMIRDDVDARYQTFDIRAVENKLVLAGAGSYAMPVLVDLSRREVTYVDLAVYSVGAHSTAEGANTDISTITREMVRMIDTRPNMRDLARYHVRARGAVEVGDRDAADVRFGLGEGDFDALKLEAVLSELL